MEIENRVYCGDCHTGLASVPAGVVHLAFVDPPFNIGFDYGDGGYEDNLPPAVYEAQCLKWMQEIYRVLRPDGTFWLAIGDEWAAELKILARQAGFHMRSWVIWYYTFGVNSPKKMTRSHASLFYFVKDPKKFTFNADAVRVPSARQLDYNDPRANPAGRLVDDTWIISPKQLPEGFPAEGDMWMIPRICGTFKQRQKGAANQMPEQLMGRIIRMCSNPNDLVLDPMAGTGTTLAVAKKLGRRYLGFELVPRFADLSAARVAAAQVGAELDGPVPQGG